MAYAEQLRSEIKRMVLPVAAATAVMGGGIGGWELGVYDDHATQEFHSHQVEEAQVCLGAINRFGGTHDTQPWVYLSEFTPSEKNACYGKDAFSELSDQGVDMRSLRVQLPKATEKSATIKHELPQTDDISIAMRLASGVVGVIMGIMAGGGLAVVPDKRRRSETVQA